uniref:Alpha-mannosidase n=1 Tax=Tetranychus truncatus TaxID=93132 RepID=A0A3G5ANZ5_9ACAR|nr:saliva protein-5 [Tetranychus truncatus]
MLTVAIYLKFAFFLSLILLTQSRPPWSKLNQKCGYEFCPHLEPDMINVHLVSHTHNDVGWLKTYEQYYWGMKTGTQRAGVQYILNSVIPELAKDPKKRFIYVESAFFWRWWTHQDEEMQNLVKQLVNQGRLEFIGGGWSMNDEAATHYSPIVDQMSYGHRFLASTFGKCGIPRVAWQIDPFGHSREQASLFAQMYFDGLFFGRLDKYDKKQRESDKTMEMVWSGSDDLGEKSYLFTGVLPNGYNPPDGFCFDDTCSDEPIVDDPTSREYNVPRKVADFIEVIRNQSAHYATNNIILTMGSDFQYQNAPIWFSNLDKLIAAMEAEKKNGLKINVFYSTPSCYLYSLYQANRTWTLKTDDFFPYGSTDHSFWGGFYTSRPAIKRYERVSNNIFQAIKQLHAASNLTDEQTFEAVDNFHRAMGILQHHDAVTGTEKQLVAFDYAYILNDAIEKSMNLMNRALQFISSKDKSSQSNNDPQYTLCLGLNISQCEIVESNDKVLVTVYNPYAHEYDVKVRIPWQESNYKVTGPNGESVNATIIPIPGFMQDFPERKSSATHELLFKATLPALGFASYFVEKLSSNKPTPQLETILPLSTPEAPITAQGKGFSASFDPLTGSIQSVSLANDKVIKLRQKYQWYAGYDTPKEPPSGAYLFRPKGPASGFPNQPTYQIFNSPDCFEVHQNISDYVSQTMRIYPDDPFIEFDFKIGPIPVADKVGKEIISLFQTDLKTNKVFYTDSNGRQMMKRVKDFRPTWKYKVIEPIAGNYYPINSRISLKDEDEDLQLVVLTDRSQGGASLNDGELEIMLHRRLLHDDSLGVDEALNEPGVDGRGLIIRGKHYVLISDIKSSNILHREKGMQLYMAPVVAFAPISSFDDYRANHKTIYSFLQRALPPNVHLLTLEHLNLNNWLVRLEHFYQSNEDPDGLSKSVRIDFRGLFNTKSIHGVKETIITATQYHSEARRLTWKTKDSQLTREIETEIGNEVHDFVVTLKPMQIRTFLLRLDD